ncbi:MAG: protein-L-isoaspartate(D-aspartate) O-methyltransferase [Candidatus Woesearchaeota archaeon]
MKESLFRRMEERGISKKVVKAISQVQRDKFVLKEYIKDAYADIPLPIHAQQTISQPSTVAIMTEALEVKAGDKVLEVGSGSGYQAAILSKLIGSRGKVFTIEIIEELARFAENNISAAGIKNVETVHGDGSLGYKKEAPYDRIIVTAASPCFPEDLFKQLKENGIMVVPSGGLYTQSMLKVKKKKGRAITQELGWFCFVPLKGKHGHR